ncbi:hypothetical protein NXC24_PC01618 (plasmid) [Rhizobium sp. NXC24]|nr:hypothetical protein NXC24_PC01618 [Rhizobium sp. NXC24]
MANVSPRHGHKKVPQIRGLRFGRIANANLTTKRPFWTQINAVASNAHLGCQVFIESMLNAADFEPLTF